jgi:hypothetical protein
MVTNVSIELSLPSSEVNVVIEWVAILLHIREVPGSNFARNTDYLDYDYSWFSSAPPCNCGDSTLY